MDADVAYAAGFIDGEGTFIMARKRTRAGVWSYRPAIAAYQRDRRPLDMLVRLFGGGVQQVKRRSRPEDGEQYMWRVQGRRAIEAAARIQPFLIVKARQADLFARLEAGETYSFRNGSRGNVPRVMLERRAIFAAELRELNASVHA